MSIEQGPQPEETQEMRDLSDAEQAETLQLMDMQMDGLIAALADPELDDETRAELQEELDFMRETLGEIQAGRKIKKKV